MKETKVFIASAADSPFFKAKGEKTALNSI